MFRLWCIAFFLAVLLTESAAYSSARPRFSVYNARVLTSPSLQHTIASRNRAAVKRMAEDGSGGEAKLAQAQAEANASLEAKKNEVQKGVADAMQKAEAMKEGSLYESDDVALMKKRAESAVSSTMKDKLKAELRSQGADMNTSFNPFPLVFAGVAVLVVANFLVGDLTSSL